VGSARATSDEAAILQSRNTCCSCYTYEEGGQRQKRHAKNLVKGASKGLISQKNMLQMLILLGIWHLRKLKLFAAN
jgi:hypothetical protein